MSRDRICAGCGRSVVSGAVAESGGLCPKCQIGGPPSEDSRMRRRRSQVILAVVSLLPLVSLAVLIGFFESQPRSHPTNAAETFCHYQETVGRVVAFIFYGLAASLIGLGLAWAGAALDRRSASFARVSMALNGVVGAIFLVLVFLLLRN